MRRTGDPNGGNDAQKDSAQTRILIVDDHPIVRDGLRHLIQAESDMTVCAEAKSGEEALRVMAEASPDLALVDLNLPGMDGVSLIRRIKADHPEVLVLVVSMLEQAGHAERALRAGASGFVTKADATEEVVSAIRKVTSGDLYVSEGLAMDIIGGFLGGDRGSPTSVASQLTDREFEVFQLIGRGLRAGQIAEALNLSVKTIETHQANIKRKLDLRDARDLAYYAMRWQEMERSDDEGPPSP